MSDLRLTFDEVQVPHSDCNQAASNVDPLKDNCHVLVSVTDGAQTHTLRFDRRKDQFDLSTKASGFAGESFNSPEKISWWVHHADSSKRILQTIRIMGATLSTKGVRKPTADERAIKAVFPLVLANYIVTGKVVFPGQPGRKDSQELAVIILDVFANSDESSRDEFIKEIGFFQAVPQLDEEAKIRVTWAVSILSQVPKYRKLMRHLIPEDKMALIDREDPVVKEHLENLQRFVAKVIIDIGMSQKLRYDQLTYEASDAYRALHGVKNGKGFCEALAEGIGKFPHIDAEEKRNFIEQCKNALLLSRMPTEQAALESLKFFLRSPEGQKAIEAEIRAEVRRSHMSPGWLADRGQIDKVARLVVNHSRVRVEYEKGETPKKISGLEIVVDEAALKVSLELLIRSEAKSKHREPVLASLGVLRLLFGRKAERRKISVFFNGDYQEVKLRYSAETMRETLKIVEEDLRISFLRSDVAWPIAQGTVGALGVASLGLGAGLKSAPTPVRQGLFIGGCSAVGFSLGSLVQLSKRARNKHIWGAVGGSIGAAVFGGACAALATQTDFLKRSGGENGMPPMPDQPERNPVDEYGP